MDNQGNREGPFLSFFFSPVNYASRFCVLLVLTRLKSKKAKQVAKALSTANTYLPFRHVVLQTDQGTEYLNSVNNILLKALVAKRFQVTNKGSHQGF